MSPAAAGQNSFAVLLFQDLAVIPILAVFPLLAAAGAVAPGAHGGAPASTWTAGLQGWAQTLAVVATVGAVIAAGRILVRPAFRFIACALHRHGSRAHPGSGAHAAGRPEGRRAGA